MSAPVAPAHDAGSGAYLITDHAAGVKKHGRRGTNLPDRGFRASGSRQLDEAPLIATLEKFLPPDGTLHLVDLRQETHAFLNGRAVSVYADKNWGNVGRSAAWIADDELQLVADLERTRTVQVCDIEKDATGRVIPVAVRDVSVVAAKTEAMVSASVPGVVYHRLPTPDHRGPFEALELLVTLLREIDFTRDWVHVHCRGGDGRTATFLALYDMASWYKTWKADRFPTLEGFADRQCQLFSYCLNPAYDCSGGRRAPSWKSELAKARWRLLGFMRSYVLNGRLFSTEPFRLPEDWEVTPS